MSLLGDAGSQDRRLILGRRPSLGDGNRAIRQRQLLSSQRINEVTPGVLGSLLLPRSIKVDTSSAPRSTAPGPEGRKALSMFGAAKAHHLSQPLPEGSCSVRNDPRPGPPEIALVNEGQQRPVVGVPPVATCHVTPGKRTCVASMQYADASAVFIARVTSGGVFIPSLWRAPTSVV